MYKQSIFGLYPCIHKYYNIIGTKHSGFFLFLYSVAYARPYVSRRLLTANKIFIELLDGSGDGQQIIWAAELWRMPIAYYTNINSNMSATEYVVIK